MAPPQRRRHPHHHHKTPVRSGGGIYIPPFKLSRNKINSDKNSVAYQKTSWDSLRKSIIALMNKVNSNNIKSIIQELFSENLVRGRGLFCRACIRAQMAAPNFSDVFAAVAAAVNSKFAEIWFLLVKRVFFNFNRALRHNDREKILALVKFIAHLVNQRVVHHGLVLLDLVIRALEKDCLEAAVVFVKECGSTIQGLCPKDLDYVFESFRGLLVEGEIIDKRARFLIDSLFDLRKSNFQGFPGVCQELDLLDDEDRFVHKISILDEKIDPEFDLDVFKVDPEFPDNEKRYQGLKKQILGEEESEDDVQETSDCDEEFEDIEEIEDQTETNVASLRRTIYLTIMSSFDFEETGHKLMSIKIEPGEEIELCIMLLECCSQERTYRPYYGLLGQRFCMINKVYQESFEKCFVQKYSTVHHLDTNQLRNVAMFFVHLLASDALSWHVLGYIRLSEEDTTSSSHVFVKILFHELSDVLGVGLLNDRLCNPRMQECFESIFPKDSVANTRFSINFFTCIGLGPITGILREFLMNIPRVDMRRAVC